MQRTLTSRNGTLSLCESPSLYVNDHEWTTSDLDKIRVEDLLEDLLLLQSKAPPTAPRSWHERCYNISPYARQYTLSKKDGIVTLQQPPYLLPLGSTVFRPEYTHESCDLGSRSSMMLLPAELRIEIYRYLLCSPRSVHYPICRSTHSLRIVPIPHHYGCLDLWPQILATCKRMNREGTPILYGENSFQREFQWPRKSYSSKKPWPLLLTCRLSSSSINSITRIELFRQYHLWLREDKLKVFHDFPSLRDLRIQFDFCDSCPVDVFDVWKCAMKSASRKQPSLKRLSCSIRPTFDNDYWDWIATQSLDFRLHRLKKAQLEMWMRQENVFTSSHFAWEFETSICEYVGPVCYVRFVVNNTRKSAPEEGVRCVLQLYDDEKVSIEPS